MFQRFWNDDDGWVYILEIIICATFLAVLLIPAVGILQKATVNEVEDLANAILSIDQTFGTCGYSDSCGNGANGSQYQDALDANVVTGIPPSLTYTVTGGSDVNDVCMTNP